MRKIRILLCALLWITSTGFCWADTTSDLVKENAELRQRIEVLERQMEELKEIVMQNAKSRQVRTEAVQKPEPGLSDEDMERLAKMVHKEPSDKKPSDKKPVLSDLDVEIYGYLKLDAAYDTSRTTPGNYTVWVDSEASNKNDNEFNMTANQTRLGFRVKGPDDGVLRTSGRAEIDFYGSGAGENKAKIQMRHAYLKLDWPKEDFSIIAGQTSDLISPLVPGTLNYTVLWDAGNIGYRRPQLRFTKGFALNNGVNMETAFALARTIGDSFQDESGEDSGFPSLQGRVGLTFPLFSYKPTTVGASAHWGEETYDTADVDTWSINFDLFQPINEWLSIKGEVFTGENLDTYFGGIGQGVNQTTYGEISSKGGWVAASLGPWDKWRFNLGIGVDDVDAGDIDASLSTQNRTLNRSIFGNAIYSINKNTDVGFELSQWHTERKGQRDADNLRAQMSFIYKF